MRSLVIERAEKEGRRVQPSLKRNSPRHSEGFSWGSAARFLGQVAVTIGLLAWLWHKLKWKSDITPALESASWPSMIAAFLVYGLVEVFAAFRWHFIVRDYGFFQHWKTSTASLLQCVFFNAVIPGLVGGDAFRVVLLLRKRPRRKVVAFSAVLMDRVFGLGGLIFLGASLVLVRYAWLHQTKRCGLLADGTLLLVAIGAIATFVPWLARHWKGAKLNSAESITDWSPRQLRGKTFAVAAGSTVAAHLCFCASFYLSARALHPIHPAAISFWDMLTITPIVNTYTSLPISLSGLGIRESIFATMLQDLCKAPASTGVLVGVLGFAIRAIWAAIGFALVRTLKWTDVDKSRRCSNAPM